MSSIFYINEKTCKGCGLCVYVCPIKILYLPDELNSKGYHVAKISEPSKCTACAACALTCPDVCIEIFKD